ncbi:Uncharacterised protein [Amycolatopsis camponoti]|uniref:Uncharacterized protein n=1 Tax=Amycolatopsis camponoti TaxID=2606593 RepID=A0A6I8LIZ6_9PSEU|nr:hypothetical protein [Amycolatopsis camponoti]VVJ16007.1 Uncharacterised protein [Amycolatopsis camponoti]
MKTPDLVFRGRRSSADRALVPVAVPVLPGPHAAWESVLHAVDESADLVGFAGTGVEPLVAWARSKCPDFVVAGDGTPGALAPAASIAGTRQPAKAVRWE